MDMVLHKTKKITISFFSLIKKFWYIALIIIVIAGYFIYKAQMASSATELKTYTVTKETLRDILALSGEIDADEKVSLHFQSGGRLAWVGVKEGDTVKKYDGIASLDQRQLQKSLEKYLNTYVKERNDFDENEDVNGDGAVGFSQELRDAARRTYDRAQLDLNNSVLDVELQAIAKEYAFLYSPIDGIVTHVGAPAAGMNVSITDTFDVINPDSIYFSVSADQTEVTTLEEGQTGTITLDAYPDEEITGTISSIAFTPKTNETGTVYEMKMNFATTEANMKYRLGMTGDVEYILKEFPDIVAIPFEYVIEENDKTYVNKQVDGKSEKVEITVGDEYEGQLEVVEGLQPGDVIYEVTQ